MNYDRQITISAGLSRKDTNWRRQTLSVSELYARLATPARGVETLAQYVKLKKAQQDDLKDVGGFMAGTLNGGRRKASAVTGRDVITLDFDNVPAWGTDSIAAKLDELGCGWCIYSTRKHAPNAPRLRVLIPTDRTMTPDEYEPCARRMAAHVGISMADPTTFEVSRLMYWPSCCSDSEYFFKTSDAPLVSVDFLLSTYSDWKDINAWPQVPGSFSYQKLAIKQGDPESKPGIVGAFCRTYDIYHALDELLPGIYDPVDTEKDRYTYVGGSTTGGAIVYDNGRFLFSHHATDPCSGRLVNSFDMVRLHKFGDADDDSDGSTPVNRLPSYRKMCEYANTLDDVAVLVMRERYDSAIKDFEGVSPTNDDDPANWLLKIKRNAQTGIPLPLIDNVCTIIDHDPELAGKVAMNEFAGRCEVRARMPWEAKTCREYPRGWRDADDAGLRLYMEKQYSITKRSIIEDALTNRADSHAFNDVQDYIRGLEWDNNPRLDTLLVDYLGATDTSYTRAVTRKAFTAAIARAMTPGCKYDTMLILCGPQGIGKSTLIDKMSRGFFNDSITTFEGKEASELVQGVWLVEIAELQAFSRSDVARIKQFLSLRTDRYRAAYGRNVQERPRTCVFFGTCNTMDFLQDPTGNRRFWPVDVTRESRKKCVFNDLDSDTINQLWAEAKVRWKDGEPLFLSGDVESEAQKQQELHSEVDPNAGEIIDFVQKQVPKGWASWSLDNRRDYWSGLAHSDKIQLIDRDAVCAKEVWAELFLRDPSSMDKREMRSINNALRSIQGWTVSKTTHRYAPYAITKGGIIRA